MMTGIVWHVQVVQYPLMQWVGEDEWTAFEQAYAFRAGLLIGPLMIVELLASLVVVVAMRGSERFVALLALVALGLVWASTFAVQVPLHERLAEGWQRDTWQTLLHSNWIRTMLWSARSVLVGTVLFRFWARSS